MRTHLECIPCFLRQALEASRFLTSDTEKQAAVMREVLALVADLPWDQQPVASAQLIHRRIRELHGGQDPYRVAKSQDNQLLRGILPDLASMIRRVPDPLLMATRLAIAANVIDLGAHSAPCPADVLPTLRRVLHEPFVGDVEAFSAALGRARTVLYLADNAGEIAVDRLLIEEIGAHRVTVAVRGTPVLNDATLADAAEVGLTGVTRVIDNGSDAPGTILQDCRADLRDRFHGVDLVIAKGQGNYETLAEAEREVFFLFKVKCPVVSADVGLPVGTHALLHHVPGQQAGPCLARGLSRAGAPCAPEVRP